MEVGHYPGKAGGSRCGEAVAHGVDAGFEGIARTCGRDIDADRVARAYVAIGVESRCVGAGTRCPTGVTAGGIEGEADDARVGLGDRVESIGQVIGVCG